MRSFGFVIIFFGLFSCYGFYKLIDNQSFIPSGYGTGRAPVEAKEDPEGFKKMVRFTGGIAIISLVTGTIMVIRGGRKK